MVTRRDFLKTASALGSSALVWSAVPEAITRAFAIDPEEGSTFLDAEHVVILMQENRSFDHAFGTLRGVRGYRDPRIHKIPSGLPAWFQPDSDGQIVPPFRLDMDGSNVTWIGGTPHSWPDQVDARNHGRYDKWLVAKRRGDKFPMTMGFFTREDIPFYYSLADAFTICDQAFCASLTGTTPNRLHLWTGTIRESANHPARVQNGDTDYDAEAAWMTFPERLEDANISWKIYQNEISLDSGLEGEYDAWLSNFTDNPIEWFSQYQVRFSKTRRARVAKLIPELEKKKDELAEQLKTATGADQEKLQKQQKELSGYLDSLREEQAKYTDAAWNALTPREKALHEKAFADNRRDSDYRELVTHSYDDNGTAREINVPKGDVLAQFRWDVENGQLPAVSWLVAPERFSDHPGSAWFGAWYLSEAMNILTANPEIWKKTIFILCYDENDGYFDHVPPFIAPHPGRPETGKTSEGLDTSLDVSKEHGRDHSIGLGYRCPLVIASPWTRGGNVNSQVCDHTSIIMFVETWLKGKGKSVKETNISDWRRTICGDLTSNFRPYKGEKLTLPEYLNRDSYVERIHKASFKERPTPAKKIDAAQTAAFDVRAFQEKGTRPSCPLPYELEASIVLTEQGAQIKLAAGNDKFKKRAAGGAFNVYSYEPEFVCRAYGVAPGDAVTDTLPTGEKCHVRIDGPNGFMRELNAGKAVDFMASVQGKGADLVVTLQNQSQSSIEVTLKDESYGRKPETVKLGTGETKKMTIPTKGSQHWYDLSVSDSRSSYRFAGRLEDGSWTTSDPAMA